MYSLNKKTAVGLIMLGFFASASMAHTTTHHAKSSQAKAKQKFVHMQSKANEVDVDKAYRLENTPQVGQTLVITLHLTPAKSGVSYRVTADEGLTLASSNASVGLSKGRQHVAQIQVTPQKEGLFYVHVFTVQGNKQSVSSIPVQVGKVGLPAEKNLKVDAKGDKVISMPAKE